MGETHLRSMAHAFAKALGFLSNLVRGGEAEDLTLWAQNKPIAPGFFPARRGAAWDREVCTTTAIR